MRQLRAVFRSFLLAVAMLECNSAVADEIVLALAPGGAASLVNLSLQHSIVLRSYSISRSEYGADLVPAEWNSFQRQGFAFLENSATVDLLAETGFPDGLALGPGQSRSIGRPFDIRADANGDGVVDLADFRIVKDNQGQQLLGPRYGDLDYNGTVDSEGDFQILLDDFGKSANFTFLATTAIPEPASSLLALAGAAAFCAQHWRRRTPRC